MVTNRSIIDPAYIEINGSRMLYANTSQHLGMTLDAKLNRKEHTMIKKSELNFKIQTAKLVAWTPVPAAHTQ